jgi:hypothetical protein
MKLLYLCVYVLPNVYSIQISRRLSIRPFAKVGCTNINKYETSQFQSKIVITYYSIVKMEYLHVYYLIILIYN